MEWISIEDRLPENDSDVLAVDVYEGFCIAWYNGDDWQNAYPCVTGYNLEDLIENITHWMHLPTKPELK